MKHLVLAGLFGLPMLAGACSSTMSPAGRSRPVSSSPVVPSGTAGITATSLQKSLSKAQAESDYFSIEFPVNSGINAFSAKARRWTSSTTQTEAGSDAQPLISALQSAIPRLFRLEQRFPPDSAAIKAEITAASNVAGDLNAIGSTKEFVPSLSVQIFTNDVSVLSAASSTVRAGLGFPPVSDRGL